MRKGLVVRLLLGSVNPLTTSRHDFGTFVLITCDNVLFVVIVTIYFARVAMNDEDLVTCLKVSLAF